MFIAVRVRYLRESDLLVVDICNYVNKFAPGFSCTWLAVDCLSIFYIFKYLRIDEQKNSSGLDYSQQWLILHFDAPLNCLVENSTHANPCDRHFRYRCMFSLCNSFSPHQLFGIWSDLQTSSGKAERYWSAVYEASAVYVTFRPPLNMWPRMLQNLSAGSFHLRRCSKSH